MVMKNERKGVRGRSFGDFQESVLGEFSAIIDTPTWL